MAGRGAAGALLALAACFACAAAAPTSNDHNALELYGGDAAEGCYYNFQHYSEGDRIMTNEPCLNCTCHNRMLMCYLRVCPFTKPIGHDCTVEKRADQCCPIVTCPHVPVDLLTSTEALTEYGATGVDRLEKYGCSINGRYYSEGSKVPPTPNKPCEHCYCIRNMTTCVMQECTLHVDGCTPIYHKDVCCPVRYSCDHPEDEIPMLEDMTTTIRPTPGFILPTTVSSVSQECVHNDEIFSDGALIKTEKACEHCYCMKGDIVCVVQECGTPMENEGKNCTSVPPREGQCCPDTYICEGDNEIPEEHSTTLKPKTSAESEGSGYEKVEEQTDISEGSGFYGLSEAPIEITSEVPDEFEVSRTSTGIPSTPSIIIDETETEDQFFTTPSQGQRKPEFTLSIAEGISSTVEPDQGENTVPHDSFEKETTSTLDSKEPFTPFIYESKETTITESSTLEIKPGEESTSEFIPISKTTPSVTQSSDETATEDSMTEKSIIPEQKEPGLSSTLSAEPVTASISETFSEIMTSETLGAFVPTFAPDYKHTSSETAKKEIYDTTQETFTEVPDKAESLATTEKKMSDKEETTEHTEKEDKVQTDTYGFTTHIIAEITTEIPLTTLSDIVQPGIIPGEGACLVGGVTYDNQSIVPTQEKCQELCKCMSSIVKCEKIQCSPPPENMINCVPKYDSEITCCPTYTCDHPKETMPPQPESQMAVTEAVITKEECGEKCVKEMEGILNECEGDNCGVQEEEIKPVKSSELCSSSDCVVPEAPVSSEHKPCSTEECVLKPSLSCTDGACDTSSVQPPEIVHVTEYPLEQPVNQLCENGLGCKPTEDRLLPGDSCEDGTCKPKVEKLPCENESGCDYVKPETSIPPCTGESCTEQHPTKPLNDSQNTLSCVNLNECESIKPDKEIHLCKDESCVETQSTKPVNVTSSECKTSDCIPTSQIKPDPAVRKEDDSCGDNQECKQTTSDQSGLSSQKCKGKDCDSFLTDKDVTLEQSFTTSEPVYSEATIAPEVTFTSDVSISTEHASIDTSSKPDESLSTEVKKPTEITSETPKPTKDIETTTLEIEKTTLEQVTLSSIEFSTRGDIITPETDKITKTVDVFEPEVSTTASSIFETENAISTEKLESSSFGPIVPIEISTGETSTSSLESDVSTKSSDTFVPEIERSTTKVDMSTPEIENILGSSSTLHPDTEFETKETDVTPPQTEQSTKIVSSPEKAESIIPDIQTSTEFINIVNKETITESHATETVPEVSATETVPESHATETVPEIHATETVTESHARETIPVSHDTEAVPEVHATEIVPESHVTETIPESYATDTVPESHVTGTVPESQGTENVSESHIKEIIPEIPITEIVTETVLQSLATETLPGSHVTEIVPESHATETVPESHATEIVPESYTKETVPEIHITVPETHTTETVPQSVATETVPESHVTEIVPEIHATETATESHVTETAPESHAPETVPGGHVTETVPEIHVTEIVTDSFVTVTVPESHAPETVPESHATETVPESPVTETILESHVPETVPESHATETVPESQVTETVAESYAPETVPESHATKIIPESHVTETVPESHTPETVPDIHAPETVPESHATKIVPESHVTETVPESHTSETVPKIPATETVPESHTTETVYITTTEKEKPRKKIESSSHMPETVSDYVTSPVPQPEEVDEETETNKFTSYTDEPKTEYYTEKYATSTMKIEEIAHVASTVSTQTIQFTENIDTLTSKTQKPDIITEESDLQPTTEKIDVAVTEVVKSTEFSHISESDTMKTDDFSTTVFETEKSTESTHTSEIDIQKSTETLTTLVPETEKRTESIHIPESEFEKTTETSYTITSHLGKSTESSPTYSSTTESLLQKTDTIVTEDKDEKVATTSKVETLIPYEVTTRAPYTEDLIETTKMLETGTQISTEFNKDGSTIAPEIESSTKLTEFDAETRKPTASSEKVEEVETEVSPTIKSTHSLPEIEITTKYYVESEVKDSTELISTPLPESEGTTIGVGVTSAKSETTLTSITSKEQSTETISTSVPEIKQSSDASIVVIPETEIPTKFVETTILPEATPTIYILEVEKTTKPVPILSSHTEESLTSIITPIPDVEDESKYSEKDHQVPVTTGELPSDHSIYTKKPTEGKVTEKTDIYETTTDYSIYGKPETTSTILLDQSTEKSPGKEEVEHTEEDHEKPVTSSEMTPFESMGTDESTIPKVTENAEVFTSKFDETIYTTSLPKDESAQEVNTLHLDLENGTEISTVKVESVTEKKITNIPDLEDKSTTSFVHTTISIAKEEETVTELMSQTTTESPHLAQEETSGPSYSSPQISSEITSSYEKETPSTEKILTETLATVSESVEKTERTTVTIDKMTEEESTTALIVQLEEHPHKHHEETGTIIPGESEDEKDYLTVKEEEKVTTHRPHEDKTETELTQSPGIPTVSGVPESSTLGVESEEINTTIEPTRHTVSEGISDEHIDDRQTTLLPETIQSFSPSKDIIQQTTLPVFDSKKETPEEQDQYQTTKIDFSPTEVTSLKPFDHTTESIQVTKPKDEDKTSEIFTTIADHEYVTAPKQTATTEVHVSTHVYDKSELTTQPQFEEQAPEKVTGVPIVITSEGSEIETDHTNTPEQIPKVESTTLKSEETVTTSRVSSEIPESTVSLITSVEVGETTTSKPIEMDLTTLIYGEMPTSLLPGIDHTVSESVEEHSRPIEDILETTLAPVDEIHKESLTTIEPDIPHKPAFEEEPLSFTSESTDKITTLSQEQLFTQEIEITKPEKMPASHAEEILETGTEKIEASKVGMPDASTVVTLEPSLEQTPTTSHSAEIDQSTTKISYETEQTERITDNIESSSESEATLGSSSVSGETVTKETPAFDKEQLYTKTTPEIDIKETDQTEVPIKAGKPESSTSEFITELPDALSTAITQQVEMETEKKSTEPPIKITPEFTQLTDSSSETPSDHDKTDEVPTSPPTLEEVQKPDKLHPSTSSELPSPDEDTEVQMQDHFPPSGGGYAPPEGDEDEQVFGPGTCRYGGKVYVSAQQIPRDDPCDFCFCFRSDIICLQQSCPPPIHGCHEEDIVGFCCPRYECPVSMATTLNVTTTTTTTTTTLPPHFLPHAYNGAALKSGCQIKGHSYNVGEVIKASSGPCMHCTCGGDGQMKCDPKACTPEPMLRQMIAAAVSSKRRR